jgi:hypothetical protein
LKEISLKAISRQICHQFLKLNQEIECCSPPTMLELERFWIIAPRQRLSRYLSQRQEKATLLPGQFPLKEQNQGMPS